MTEKRGVEPDSSFSSRTREILALVDNLIADIEAEGRRKEAGEWKDENSPQELPSGPIPFITPSKPRKPYQESPEALQNDSERAE